MGKKSNFKREYLQMLKSQSHFGESKIDKKIAAKKEAQEKNETAKPVTGIYATNTMNSYAKACKLFSSYLIENHPEVKRFSDGKPYVAEWLKSKEDKGCSPFTLANYGSAVARAFGISKNDFGYEYPTRHSKNIFRNRGETPERYTNERFDDARLFCKATGARRCEILRLRRSDFRESEDGTYEVYLKGKNSMSGWRVVIPQYTEDVKRMFETYKGHQITTAHGLEERLFERRNLPSNLHQHRAEYACSLYDYFMERGYATGELYHCRGERRGESFDKGILKEVSEMMFHHRLDVVVTNYLYGYYK